MLIAPPRPILAMTFLLAIFLCSRSLFAQLPVKQKIPGSAFVPERPDKVVFDNVAGGRRFRGQAGAKIVLQAPLRIPPPTMAVSKVQRLVLHFRTSPGGPVLVGVGLRTARVDGFHADIRLEGDFRMVERSAPSVPANAWDWKYPIAVYPQTVVRLEVQFPVGFDSKINPGDIVVTSVDVSYPETVARRVRRVGR